jgi:hypothetical protein
MPCQSSYHLVLFSRGIIVTTVPYSCVPKRYQRVISKQLS